MAEEKTATKSIRLNARGLDRLGTVAAMHGISKRELLERLMHYAISTYERPGSWESSGFLVENYGPEGYADRWF